VHLSRNEHKTTKIQKKKRPKVDRDDQTRCAPSWTHTGPDRHTHTYTLKASDAHTSQQHIHSLERHAAIGEARTKGLKQATHAGRHIPIQSKHFSGKMSCFATHAQHNIHPDRQMNSQAEVAKSGNRQTDRDRQTDGEDAEGEMGRGGQRAPWPVVHQLWQLSEDGQTNRQQIR